MDVEDILQPQQPAADQTAAPSDQAGGLNVEDILQPAAVRPRSEPGIFQTAAQRATALGQEVAPYVPSWLQTAVTAVNLPVEAAGEAAARGGRRLFQALQMTPEQESAARGMPEGGYPMSGPPQAMVEAGQVPRPEREQQFSDLSRMVGEQIALETPGRLLGWLPRVGASMAARIAEHERSVQEAADRALKARWVDVLKQSGQPEHVIETETLGQKVQAVMPSQAAYVGHRSNELHELATNAGNAFASKDILRAMGGEVDAQVGQSLKYLDRVLPPGVRAQREIDMMQQAAMLGRSIEDIRPETIRQIFESKGLVPTEAQIAAGTGKVPFSTASQVPGGQFQGRFSDWEDVLYRLSHVADNRFAAEPEQRMAAGLAGTIRRGLKSAVEGTDAAKPYAEWNDYFHKVLTPVKKFADTYGDIYNKTHQDVYNGLVKYLKAGETDEAKPILDALGPDLRKDFSRGNLAEIASRSRQATGGQRMDVGKLMDEITSYPERSLRLLHGDNTADNLLQLAREVKGGAAPPPGMPALAGTLPRAKPFALVKALAHIATYYGAVTAAHAAGLPHAWILGGAANIALRGPVGSVAEMTPQFFARVMTDPLISSVLVTKGELVGQRLVQLNQAIDQLIATDQAKGDPSLQPQPMSPPRLLFQPQTHGGTNQASPGP